MGKKTRARRSEKSADAGWVGDKRPHFLKFAPSTFENMTGYHVTVVHIVRPLTDVALSYEARAANPDDRFWSPMRNSDEAVADAVQASDYLVSLASGGLQPGHRVLLVPYGRVFADADCARDLYDRLGVSIDAALERKLSAYMVKSARVMGRPRSAPDWMQEQVARAQGHPSVAAVDEMLRESGSIVTLASG